MEIRAAPFCDGRRHRLCSHSVRSSPRIERHSRVAASYIEPTPCTLHITLNTYSGNFERSDAWRDSVHRRRNHNQL